MVLVLDNEIAGANRVTVLIGRRELPVDVSPARGFEDGSRGFPDGGKLLLWSFVRAVRDGGAAPGRIGGRFIPGHKRLEGRRRRQAVDVSR